MRVTISLVLIALSCSAAGCATLQEVELKPNDEIPVEQAMTLWRSTSRRTYELTYTVDTFPWGLQTHTVLVRNGKPRRHNAFFHRETVETPDGPLTINDLFKLLTSCTYPCEIIRPTFDSTYGIPISFELNIAELSDSFVGYDVTSYRVYQKSNRN